MKFLFLNQTQFPSCTFNLVVLWLQFQILHVDLCPVGLLRANFWGVFSPFWNKLLYRVPGVCSQCCAPVQGLAHCVLVTERSCYCSVSWLCHLPSSLMCWAMLLFWTGQPCHYLALEFSVCGLCIVYPYGQMANLIRL